MNVPQANCYPHAPIFPPLPQFISIIAITEIIHCPFFFFHWNTTFNSAHGNLAMCAVWLDSGQYDLSRKNKCSVWVLPLNHAHKGNTLGMTSHQNRRSLGPWWFPRVELVTSSWTSLWERNLICIIVTLGPCHPQLMNTSFHSDDYKVYGKSYEEKITGSYSSLC